MSWDTMSKLGLIAFIVLIFLWVLYYIDSSKGIIRDSSGEEVSTNCKQVDLFVRRCDFGDVECFTYIGNGISCLKKEVNQ